MNKKDIEQWTREAGGFDATPKFLAKFAALVAFAEREACIKAIEDQIGWDMDDPESTAIKAIRARGQA